MNDQIEEEEKKQNNNNNFLNNSDQKNYVQGSFSDNSNQNLSNQAINAQNSNRQQSQFHYQVSNVHLQQNSQHSHVNKFRKFISSVFGKQYQIKENTYIQIYSFLGLGLFCMLLGFILLLLNNGISEIYIEDYQKPEVCIPQKGSKTCKIDFEIKQNLMPPIYMYYHIDNMYQNHRKYQNSRSPDQLLGKSISKDDADTYCKPVVYNKDLNLENYVSYDNKILDPDAIANPCGLIAKSFFNDTYVLQNKKNSRVSISEKGISWPGDKGNKYKRSKSELQWIDPEDEHFIVWMRTAGLSDFQKLWGIIKEPLLVEHSPYTLTVNNNYNVEDFEGAKGILFSTAGSQGGKQNGLMIFFFILGVIFLLIGLYYRKNEIIYRNAIQAENECINQYPTTKKEI